MATKVIIEKIGDITYGDPYRAIARIAAIDEDEVLATDIVEVPLTDVLANGYGQIWLNARIAALDWANNVKSYGILDEDILSPTF